MPTCAPAPHSLPANHRLHAATAALSDHQAAPEIRGEPFSGHAACQRLSLRQAQRFLQKRLHETWRSKHRSAVLGKAKACLAETAAHRSAGLDWLLSALLKHSRMQLHASRVALADPSRILAPMFRLLAATRRKRTSYHSYQIHASHGANGPPKAW